MTVFAMEDPNVNGDALRCNGCGDLSDVFRQDSCSHLSAETWETQSRNSGNHHIPHTST
jgi:hypothetical protein